jgi:hypothetical protein
MQSDGNTSHGPLGQVTPRAILVSDWLLLKKSSPLKLLDQMEPNSVPEIIFFGPVKN